MNHKILANWCTGATGNMIAVGSWVAENINHTFATITCVAGMILTVVSAANAINAWRDRRTDRRPPSNSRNQP